jgi:hypothetical protein
MPLRKIVEGLETDNQSISQEQHNYIKNTVNEFSDGFLVLNSLPGNTVTFFGGGREKAKSKTYLLVEEIASYFARNHWGVVSGGGPGVMAAAIKGAKKYKSKSIAFTIDIKDEEVLEKADITVSLSNMAVRKYLLRQSDVIITAPGGLGTLDEIIELLTLVKIGKYPQKKLIFLDKAFWEGFFSWLSQTVVNDRGLVDEGVFNCFRTVDSLEELVEVVKI